MLVFDVRTNADGRLEYRERYWRDWNLPRGAGKEPCNHWLNPPRDGAMTEATPTVFWAGTTIPRATPWGDLTQEQQEWVKHACGYCPEHGDFRPFDFCRECEK